MLRVYLGGSIDYADWRSAAVKGGARCLKVKQISVVNVVKVTNVVDFVDSSNKNYYLLLS